MIANIENVNISKINSFAYGSEWEVINTNDSIENYSHVFIKSVEGVSSNEWEYMIIGCPNNKIGQCYYKIICLAERRKFYNDPGVHIYDIFKIINDINRDDEVSGEIVKISIGGVFKTKIDDMDITYKHVYRFPMDDLYMVIGDEPDTIYFMIGGF